MLWTDLLTANGVDLRAVDAGSVALNGLDPMRVMHLARPLRRRDLDRVLAARSPGLLVASSISGGCRRDLEAAGWSWIDEDAEVGVVAQLDGLALDDVRVTPAQNSELSEWPRGVSAFAIVRSLLLSHGPSRQSDLASATGFSQPLVSRTLNRLCDDDLVVRSDSGWAARDWSRLARWWVARYRGPGGVRLRFATAVEPWAAVDQILEAAKSANVEVAFSGAIAADATAPWTEPSSVVCYADGHLALDETALVESADPQAGVQIIVPADDSVWSSTSEVTMALRTDSVPVTDPLQTAWHIFTENGRSAEEQVSRVLDHAGRDSSSR